MKTVNEIAQAVRCSPQAVAEALAKFSQGEFSPEALVAVELARRGVDIRGLVFFGSRGYR